MLPDLAALGAAMKRASAKMRPAEMHEGLNELGWSVRKFAEKAKISLATAQRMSKGRTAVYPDLARWIRRLVRLHHDNPPPRVAKALAAERPPN